MLWLVLVPECRDFLLPLFLPCIFGVDAGRLYAVLLERSVGTPAQASKPTIKAPEDDDSDASDALDSSRGGLFPMLSQPSGRLLDVSDSGCDCFSPVPDLVPAVIVA